MAERGDEQDPPGKPGPGERPRRRDTRVRFPFGESIDGSFDRYMRDKQLDPDASDALGQAFQSEPGATPLPLLAPDVAPRTPAQESDSDEIASPLSRKAPAAARPAASPAPPPRRKDDDSSLEIVSPLERSRPAPVPPPPRRPPGVDESSEIQSPLPKRGPSQRFDPADSLDGPVFMRDSAESGLGSDEGILADSADGDVDFPASGEGLLVPPGTPRVPAAPSRPSTDPQGKGRGPNAGAPPREVGGDPFASVKQPGPLTPTQGRPRPGGPAGGPLTPAQGRPRPGGPAGGPLTPTQGRPRPGAAPGPLTPTQGRPRPGQQTLPPAYPSPGATPSAGRPRPGGPGGPGTDPFGTGRQQTLPPAYPAPAQGPADPFASAKQHTLPPSYPAPAQGGAQRTLPPNYPAPEAGGAQRTLPPSYPQPAALQPADPFASVKQRTLPPSYPAPTQGGAQRTLPPNYPAPETGGAQRTLPPSYPQPAALQAGPGAQPPESQRTLPPSYPQPAALAGRTPQDLKRTLPPHYAADLEQATPRRDDPSSEEAVPKGHALRNLISTKADEGSDVARGEFDPVATSLSREEEGSGASYSVSLSADGKFDVKSDVGQVEAAPPRRRDEARTPARPGDVPSDALRTLPEELDEFDEVVPSSSDLAAVPPPGKGGSGRAPTAGSGRSPAGAAPGQRPGSARTATPGPGSARVAPPGAGSTRSPGPGAPGSTRAPAARADKASRLEKYLSGPRPALQPLRALGSESGEWIAEESAEWNAAALLRNLNKLSDTGLISGSGSADPSGGMRRTMELPAVPRGATRPGSLFASDEVTPLVLPGSEASAGPTVLEGPPGGSEVLPLGDSESGLGDASSEAVALPLRAPSRPGDSDVESLSGESAVSDVEAASGEGAVSDEGAISGEGSAVGLLEPEPETESARLEAFFTRVIQLWEGDALWILLSLGGALLGPLFVVLAWDYYGLPRATRAQHHLHDYLKPGGEYGLVFGIAAALLFLANLSYVLRRRFGLFRRLISLRLWLNVHFVCGLVGGSLVVAHSALLFDSQPNVVALVCTVAIAVAVVSGVFGRYVLYHLPRYSDDEEEEDPQTSRERELGERKLAAERLGELTRQIRRALADQPRLRDAALAAIESAKDPPRRGLLFALPMMLADVRAMIKNRSLARELRLLLRDTQHKHARSIIQDTIQLIRNQSRLERRLAEADAVRDLMDTWRGIHFIMALIVVVTMVLHVFLSRFAV